MESITTVTREAKQLREESTEIGIGSIYTEAGPCILTPK
jgi:hypothetical protein